MEENFAIWDFTLSDKDMATINALDLGHSEIIDHSAAETAKWLNGWKIHRKYQFLRSGGNNSENL